MSSPSTNPAPPPLLHVHLSPSRSLTRQGQAIAIGVFGAASLAVSLLFISQGYWPIAPFLALDAGLLAFAFFVIARRGRAYEEVVVEPDTIRILRADGISQIVEDRIPTAWTRLERDDDPDFGCQALRLRHRRRSATIADMLSPAERDNVAALLAEALARAHRGGLAARQPVLVPAALCPIPSHTPFRRIP